MKQIQLFIPILQTWKQRWVKEFLRSHVWKEAESRLDSGSLAPAQSVSFSTLVAMHFERALWVFCVLLCSSVCLALSIWAWAYQVLFQLEGVGQMAALSFGDGPERTTALCNCRGRYSQWSMKGPGHSFCMFVFGAGSGDRYQNVELRICVFICDNVSESWKSTHVHP